MLLTLFNARRLEEGVNNSDTTRFCTLKDIPILTYHGTADNEISIHETERMAESLKNNTHIKKISNNWIYRIVLNRVVHYFYGIQNLTKAI